MFHVTFPLPARSAALDPQRRSSWKAPSRRWREGCRVGAVRCAPAPVLSPLIAPPDSGIPAALSGLSVSSFLSEAAGSSGSLPLPLPQGLANRCGSGIWSYFRAMMTMIVAFLILVFIIWPWPGEELGGPALIRLTDEDLKESSQQLAVSPQTQCCSSEATQRSLSVIAPLL